MENYNTKLVKFAASSRNCILVMDGIPYKAIPINYKNTFINSSGNISLLDIGLWDIICESKYVLKLGRCC